LAEGQGFSFLYLFPRSGQGFSFFQTLCWQRGQGFLLNSCWKTFPVPVLCQTNTIRNIRHLEKVGFGRVFCFPLEAFVAPRAAPSAPNSPSGNENPSKTHYFLDTKLLFPARVEKKPKKHCRRGGTKLKISFPLQQSATTAKWETKPLAPHDDFV
jgi:hypothetical protein